MLKNIKKSKKNINYILKKTQKCTSMLIYLNNLLNEIPINIHININEMLKKLENLIENIKNIKNKFDLIENLIFDYKNQQKIIDFISSELNSLLLETNNNMENYKNSINEIYELLKNFIETSYTYYQKIPKLT